MPRTARSCPGVYTYRVLNRGNARATVFHGSDDDDAFLEVMAEASIRVSMRVPAAARDAIAPLLDANERSVGTFIEVEHLGPAPEGFTVKYRARVIHIAGPAITFQVEAHDGFETIAKGIHRRRVIDVDRFARRVEKKRVKLNDSGK